MDTGPSFNTQREQSFQLMLQLMQFNPEIATVAGDLILKDSPLVNAKEIAERIKKTMNPQVLGNEQAIPPQVQAQVQQMDQLIQQQLQQIDELSQQVNDKNADREVEIQKTILQAEQAIKVAQINNAGRADVEELRGIVELLKQRIDLENTPQDWLQKGEGIQNYEPEPIEQQLPQSDGFEPPPDMTQQGVKNPAIEQGFLMPEEMAQKDFALSPDQPEESALINDGVELAPNMEQENDG